MHFKIDESAAISNRLTLVDKINSETILGDMDLGEVCVPIKELLEGSSSSSPDKTAKTDRVEEPVTANPAEASTSSLVYLPISAAPVATTAVYPPLREGRGGCDAGLAQSQAPVDITNKIELYDNSHDTGWDMRETKIELYDDSRDTDN
ncbi:hypothetical protein QVD17_39394 [Tagetes erecta]|uniref:Uncharacterized protein n=1 Tax=Tagetes erecta TaxID=13708 RepID=A0AAD8JNH2_TARER|nr:hypothetical protein QVD17_39394 [Tagetes erecta]